MKNVILTMVFFMTLNFLNASQASVADDIVDSVKQGAEVVKEKTHQGLEYLDKKTQPLQEKSKTAIESLKKKWNEAKDKDKTLDEQLREEDLI